MNFYKHLSKIFLLFFFLAQAGTLKAQTYQPMAVDSTLWLNYLYYFEQTPQGGISHRDTAFFVINGDTLANGKLWKKFKLWTHYIFPEFNGLIRDDISNRKVWFKMLPPFTLDTTEILLYDFNVQVGDTFYIEGWVLDTMTNGNPSPNAMMSEWYTSNYLFVLS